MKDLELIKKENEELRQYNEHLIERVNKLKEVYYGYHDVCELCLNNKNKLYTCDVCKHTKCAACAASINNHMDFWYICDASNCNYAVHVDCTTKQI